MNKMLIFLIIIIIAAITVVMLLNKSASSKSPLTNLDINGTPTVVPLSPTPKTSPASTMTVTLTPEISPTTSSDNLKATRAVIKTSKGDIEVQLYPDVAPKTVTNFAKKAQNDFYKTLTFHRVEDWVIQGGDPKGDGTGGNDMVTEVSNKPFVTGSLGIAGHQGEGGIISNDAQFFITKKDSQFLNGQYTNFGIVTKGMDVVNKIEIGDKILEITTE